MTQSQMCHWMETHPQLATMVMRFNHPLASTIHPERRTWDSTLNLTAIESTARGRRRMSRELQSTLQLADSAFFDFEPPLRRFALLTWEELKRLVTLAGAVCVGKSITRLIRRDDRKRVCDQLGEDLFQFAVQKSQLTSNFPQYDCDVSDLSSERMEIVGWNLFASCYVDEPAAFLTRLQLKAPRKITLMKPLENEFDALLNSTGRQSVLQHLKKITISEIRPDLATCFE
ncbi:SctK family type III secretion system sorting platform protein [Thalassoglobus sp. JC818]|uniref:SctK family type III secretion system sorting platform protein n=1 Tax=Thalassoglobus sp. JC818 TaxID=3232136 RepID=UPI00345A1FD2